ncbi:hypothetical protein GGP41_005743 [Bipolaris sorokiniana]|uniref:Uncharacterized protein n=1 Tax=Cochliobolus sativus TaxID=45130 RepID=A0A8H6DVS1_COCSA|nr:hypothetical protein GGP41_005743 [Bipolaris sorokiniana]
MGARPVCSLVFRSRWKILLFVMVDPCIRLPRIFLSVPSVSVWCSAARTPICDLVLLPTNNVSIWPDNTCGLTIRHVRPMLGVVVVARTRSSAFCRMFCKSRGLPTHGATTWHMRSGHGNV